MNPTTSPSIRRILAMAASVALCWVLLTACSGTTDAAPCTPSAKVEASEAIVLLADGRSAALTAAASSIADHPDVAFTSSALGFKPADDGGAAPSGLVILATYDNRGNVTTQGTFDLAGAGNDAKVRERSRRHEAACLKAAVAALATPRGGHSDLLRTLERASALGAEQGGSTRVAVVATGLGRSAIDGQPVEGIDLSAEGQRQVFAELDRVGLVPDLSTAGIALRLVDPSEGVASSVAAGGIESFAGALCDRVQADACSTGPALGR